mmetsp:Transcript_17689/g.26502  ORF Transcript_17689/g.26502 Transcript_17689/m.26502 type:complete len:193 (-) Transcript_17689:19-597(-)
MEGGPGRERDGGKGEFIKEFVKVLVLMAVALIFVGVDVADQRNLGKNRSNARRMAKIVSKKGRYSWRKSGDKRSNITVRGLDSRHATKWLEQKNRKRRHEERKKSAENIDNWNNQMLDESEGDIALLKPSKKSRYNPGDIPSPATSEFRPINRFRCTVPKRKEKKRRSDNTMSKLQKAEFPGFEFLTSLKDL